MAVAFVLLALAPVFLRTFQAMRETGLGAEADREVRLAASLCEESLATPGEVPATVSGIVSSFDGRVDRRGDDRGYHPAVFTRDLRAEDAGDVVRVLVSVKPSTAGGGLRPAVRLGLVLSKRPRAGR